MRTSYNPPNNIESSPRWIVPEPSAIVLITLCPFTRLAGLVIWPLEGRAGESPD